jgi:hypothetical protein
MLQSQLNEAAKLPEGTTVNLNQYNVHAYKRLFADGTYIPLSTMKSKSESDIHIKAKPILALK